MELIKLKDRPDIARLVRLVSRKQKAFLARPTNQVSLSNTYWDGGSRSVYFLVHVDSGKVDCLPAVAPAQFGGPKQDPVQALSPGYAVIDAGVFCGQPATPVVYLPINDQ